MYTGDAVMELPKDKEDFRVIVGQLNHYKVLNKPIYGTHNTAIIIDNLVAFIDRESKQISEITTLPRAIPKYQQEHCFKYFITEDTLWMM